MLDKKIQQSSLCKLDSTVVNNRQHDFGMATKLLYQYKAAVAMWNYLVRSKSGMTEVLIAPQDYTGFVIQSKRNIDSCGKEVLLNPTFTVSITLQTGQTKSYLEALQCGMGFYINKVDDNTYIQYGRDTGITRQHSSSDVQMEVSSLSYLQDGQIQLQIRFTFYPIKQAASIFSASVKILPVIYKLGYNYPSYNEQGEVIQTYQAPQTSPVKTSLAQWVAWRARATTIQQAMQTATNRWFINTQWFQQVSMEQSFYYSTAYSKYTKIEGQ